MDPEETRRFGHLTAAQFVEPIGFDSLFPLTLVASPRTTQIVQSSAHPNPCPEFPVEPWLFANSSLTKSCPLQESTGRKSLYL